MRNDDPIDIEASEPWGCPQDQMNAERAYRRKVLKSGVICFNGRHSTYPCALRNISDHGARLMIDMPERVPNNFELHIELDGLWAECEVVWRGYDSLGVRFVNPPRTVAPRRRQTISPYIPARKPLARAPAIKSARKTY
jgi:hypothetical protein